MEQINSKRILLKASYVLTELTPRNRADLAGRASRGMEKANFLRALVVAPEQLAEVRQSPDPNVSRLARLLSDLPASNTAAATLVAEVPEDAFLELADALPAEGGSAVNRYLRVAFAQRLTVAPVGRLHLERLEMAPAGTEKGELMFTVPLTPAETVTVSHKEWATGRDEYERIVQDSFESYSERGVVEKTDASLTTENETKHSSAFNFNASAGGSYGPVSVSVSTGLTNTSENRQSVKASTQQSREITQKASARARQEHKVSVKLESVRGTEDASYRTITNPHADKALRVDYFRMMRKWKIDHFRYGLRLTFDIAVPNPGASLWAKYEQLDELDRMIRKPFHFDLAADDITADGVSPSTDGNWNELAAEYGVAVEPPPAAVVSLSQSRRFEENKLVEGAFEFTAPPGYVVQSAVQGRFLYWGPTGTPQFIFTHKSSSWTFEDKGGGGAGAGEVTTLGISAGDRLTVPFMRDTRYEIQMVLVAHAAPSTRTMREWRQRVWTALRDATFAAYQAQVAQLQSRRDRLWAELISKDTLTLRRMEREELLRGVLTWLIGPEFQTSPKQVSAILKALLDREVHDKPDSAQEPALTAADWQIVAGFGDLVKFIHQAVEWENLLYFLYPYFWGSDDLGRQKLLFDHPDPGHRDFLRAGYARVVVPIRPGFEAKFTGLLETGTPGGQPSPYLTIAEEVAAFARTNYAGIPPANPERHARPLLYPQQRTTWATMEKIIQALEDFRLADGDYPATLAELPGAPYADAWGNEFVYVLPGSGNEYDLISLGADGQEGGEGIDADISAGAGASLMATWHEYTPTSGIDIEVQAIPL